MNRKSNLNKKQNRVVLNRTAKSFKNGDVVGHNHNNEVGVVIGRTASQVIVQTTPGVTRTWYSTSVHAA